MLSHVEGRYLKSPRRAGSAPQSMGNPRGPVESGSVARASFSNEGVFNMSVRSLIACGALLGSSALADDSAERAKLNGSWQAEGEGGAPKTVWILESRGDTYHIANSQGTKTIDRKS